MVGSSPFLPRRSPLAMPGNPPALWGSISSLSGHYYLVFSFLPPAALASSQPYPWAWPWLPAMVLSPQTQGRRQRQLRGGDVQRSTPAGEHRQAVLQTAGERLMGAHSVASPEHTADRLTSPF